MLVLCNTFFFLVHRIQAACRCFIRSPPRDVEAHEDGTVSFQIKGTPASCFEAYELLRDDVVEPITFAAAEVNLGRPSDVAILIGPGGASIRAIMEESGAKVVTRPREERSDLVVLEGAPDSVQRAHQLMVETIAKGKQESDSGYRSSRSVATVTSSPNPNSPTSYHQSKPNNSSPGRQWGAPKQPKFAGGAKEETDEGEENSSGTASDAPPAETRKERPERKDRPPPEATLEIPFPAERTGLLFGKNASTVKQIKSKSKAQVFVDVNALVVRVSGSVKAVDVAKGMIQVILEKPLRAQTTSTSASGATEAKKAPTNDKTAGESAQAEQAVEAKE